MSKKLSAIGTVILAGLFVMPLSAPAYASECLSSPGESAPGRHWFYWTDKISKQRCWFAKKQPKRLSATHLKMVHRLEIRAAAGTNRRYRWRQLPECPKLRDTKMDQWRI